jgi:hypothetical protein
MRHAACGGNRLFNKSSVGVLALALSVTVTGARGQHALSANPTLPPGDPTALESGLTHARLSCQVESEQARLGFDLHFHANYRVTVPIKMLADAGKSLDIMVRVTSGSP